LTAGWSLSENRYVKFLSESTKACH
jgi:hypothetical protein